VIGAKSASICAILIDNGEPSKITGSIKPDYIIGDIEELIKIKGDKK